MKKIGIFLLAVSCVFSLTLIYANVTQEELSKNLLRMHIIANSNSAEDQAVKLAVRDNILKNSNKNTSPKELENVAAAELERLGAEYGAKTTIERCYVPEKEYKDIRLPEGFYNCVRVVLGKGKGENWWCVAYPPLCFSEEVFGGLSEDGEKQLEAVLDEKTLKTIVKNGDINIRFKIVEEMKKIQKYL